MLSDKEFKDKWHNANQRMVDFEEMNKDGFLAKYPEYAHLSDSDIIRKILWEHGLR